MTDQPGPILRAMMQAAGHDPDEPIDIAWGVAEIPTPGAVAEAIKDANRLIHGGSRTGPLVPMSLAEDVYREMLISSPTYMLLQDQLGLNRKSHFEDFDRPRLRVLWEGIWFALLRWLIGYVLRVLRNADDRWGEIEPLMAARGVHPPKTHPVLIFDETEDEYIARLRERALKGPGVGIPVHANPNVPRGTAYLFDPKELEFDSHTAVKVVLDDHEPGTPLEEGRDYTGMAFHHRPGPSQRYVDALLSPTSYEAIRVDPDEEPHAAP